MEMIEKGQTIPGVRQIPNIISTQTPEQSISNPRPKPWEKKSQEEEEKIK